MIFCYYYAALDNLAFLDYNYHLMDYLIIAKNNNFYHKILQNHKKMNKKNYLKNK